MCVAINLFIMSPFLQVSQYEITPEAPSQLWLAGAYPEVIEIIEVLKSSCAFIFYSAFFILPEKQQIYLHIISDKFVT